jgi:hypothetical protein
MLTLCLAVYVRGQRVKKRNMHVGERKHHLGRVANVRSDARLRRGGEATREENVSHSCGFIPHTRLLQLYA